MRRNRWPRAMTLTELLVVLAIFGVVLGLILAAVQRIRESASRMHCQNSLRQIGLALQLYHDIYHCFPPGVSYQNGKDPNPFMSWQAHLLPFLDQQALWNLTLLAYQTQPDFRVDPPHVGFAMVLPAFACTSDPRTFSLGDANGLRVAFTDYLGVEGINLLRRDGIFYLDSNTRIAAITDGTSNTLAVGERPPSADGAFGWWYAGWGQAKDGSADSVLGVAEKNFSQYHHVNCPRGPYEYGPGRSDNMCDTFHFWSYHPSGANFLCADGSVHFLAYTAAPVMRALATRSGGEGVALPD